MHEITSTSRKESLQVFRARLTSDGSTHVTVILIWAERCAAHNSLCSLWNQQVLLLPTYAKCSSVQDRSLNFAKVFFFILFITFRLFILMQLITVLQDRRFCFYWIFIQPHCSPMELNIEHLHASYSRDRWVDVR